MSTPSTPDVDQATVDRAVIQVERAVRTHLQDLEPGDETELSLDELCRAVPDGLERAAVEAAMVMLAAQAGEPLTIERDATDTVRWRIEIAGENDSE